MSTPQVYRTSVNLLAQALAGEQVCRKFDYF